MVGFSGVWDRTLEQRVIGFAGLLGLLLIAYAGAAASGAQFVFRLLF